MIKFEGITKSDVLTYEEKTKELFISQKSTLDLFLERNAISKSQYEKSLGDLIEKMGMQDVITKLENQDA